MEGLKRLNYFRRKLIFLYLTNILFLLITFVANYLLNTNPIIQSAVYFVAILLFILFLYFIQLFFVVKYEDLYSNKILIQILEGINIKEITLMHDEGQFLTKIFNLNSKINIRRKFNIELNNRLVKLYETIVTSANFKGYDAFVFKGYIIGIPDEINSEYKYLFINKGRCHQYPLYVHDGRISEVMYSKVKNPINCRNIIEFKRYYKRFFKKPIFSPVNGAHIQKKEFACKRLLDIIRDIMKCFEITS